MTCPRYRPVTLGILLVILSACGGIGVGSGSGTGSDPGIDAAQGNLLPEYLVIDLAGGAAEPSASVPDLATNAAYRDRYMVFRRVMRAGTVIGSQPGDAWAPDDEPASVHTVDSFFLAVFPVTRSQWQRLAGTTPWRDAIPSGLVGSSPDGALPACGLSLVMIEAACARWRNPGTLSVPNGIQWERAARAGSLDRFPWGSAQDQATVARHAAVRPALAAVGPQDVGGRDPNALGLYVMSGNIWQWTSDSRLRGGSWNDGLPMARCANQIDIDPDIPHALAGVRLVYTF